MPLNDIKFFFFLLADKHKVERFLRPDAPTVMSVYAPITFPTAGVLVFKQRDNGGENHTKHLNSKRELPSPVQHVIQLFLFYLYRRYAGPGGHRYSFELCSSACGIEENRAERTPFQNQSALCCGPLHVL